MNTLYVLVADKAAAKLYKTGCPPAAMTLLYQQRNFGGGGSDAGADAEFAKSLCKVLKADHQAGKYDKLAVITCGAMLAAIRKQLDSESGGFMLAKVVEFPTQLAEQDLIAQLRGMLALPGETVNLCDNIPEQPDGSR